MSSKKTKTPWPTKEAMAQIYEKGLWGRNASGFYSGEGSHHPDLVDPYVKVVTEFFQSLDKPPVVVDLGCGDFNVGKQLLPFAKQYIAVDIVEELIAYNKAQFQADHLEFHCLDIATDDLPIGDVVIMRQVMQHLSNKEIQQILPKLKHFKYIILTEHIPEGDFTPNLDIISGQGTRLKQGSGVDVLEEPFSYKFKRSTEIFRVRLSKAKGVITTVLCIL
ncbi:class I SAM-dependent methyltransferase [Psychroserpens sp.]|uniref:class I SAM-dependent methyltransferase n=1 Tax=Psychroserpens sp. TaxID=2020870 RepID=UPI001B098D79|nr:class I SAM-dependent methyltransferase [Psychroserpens sp.]MBO6606326.1 class I SAM-dependent methyltransferase [Psychroserpens sp.]MBO6653030.1 class I SAM-dependent methyltransferase [Psychroserpens sp.]MBO6680943.1 class I SAM-dependent methyltransferase [Psychroserpens sp.]MBO6750101.1 class I SAM-dependent methyltransferase [Psychroserpens sp.]MBO6914581.1 class I SAM-dependent methyltransferase [Psychroserpens sp.]